MPPARPHWSPISSHSATVSHPALRPGRTRWIGLGPGDAAKTEAAPIERLIEPQFTPVSAGTPRGLAGCLSYLLDVANISAAPEFCFGPVCSGADLPARPGRGHVVGTPAAVRDDGGGLRRAGADRPRGAAQGGTASVPLPPAAAVDRRPRGAGRRASGRAGAHTPYRRPAVRRRPTGGRRADRPGRRGARGPGRRRPRRRCG